MSHTSGKKLYVTDDSDEQAFLTYAPMFVITQVRKSNFLVIKGKLNMVGVKEELLRYNC